MPFGERKPDGDTQTGTGVVDYPFFVKCPKEGCGYTVVCTTIEQAAHEELNHICPRARVLSGKENRRMLKVVENIWNILDAKMDRYSTSQMQSEKDMLGNEMRGIAIALAEIMNPYFTTSDEIVREVLARRAAREANMERNTIGIGHISIFPLEGGTPWGRAYGDTGYTSDPALMADPPAGYPQHLVDAARHKTDQQAAQAKRTAAKPPVPAVKKSTFIPASITAENKATIKAQIAAGFTPEMLMTAYSCTREVIDAIMAEA